MTEFELIKKYFTASVQPDWLAIGVGDDGAVVNADSRQLVVVTDTLVESVHFFAGTSAKAIGHKALAVNLSDLAAMGAEPRWITLNLTLPEPNEAWLADFAAGLHALAAQFGVALIGGDTTAGPLTVSVTAGGYLPMQQAPLQRSGAKPGDQLCVVGQLGLAALAVAARQSGKLAPSVQSQALDFPQPRVNEAQQLVGLASAAIDVSDGLLADLGHLLQASGVGAELDGDGLAACVPVTCLEDRQPAAQAMLSGGDDYALLFTLPATVDVPAWATRIGKITQARSGAIELMGGASWLRTAFEQASQVPGFQHF